MARQTEIERRSSVSKQELVRARHATAQDSWGPMASASFAPVSLLIPGGPAAPRRARHAVFERLRDHLSDRAAHAVGIVISELVTNSVVHAGAGPGRYLRVNVGVVDEHLLIAVSDRGSLTVPRLGAIADGEPNGLGLRLVDGLATSWGVARDGTGRTQVWCQLALSEHSAR